MGVFIRWAASALLGSLMFVGPGYSLPPSKPSASAADPPMVFVVVRNSLPKCEPHCPQWIQADGRIVEGTAAKFASFLSDPSTHALPVVFQSNGGSMEDAMAMGRLLRRFHMTTAVGRTAFTGCSPVKDHSGNCKPDGATGAYVGVATAAGAWCASACPLAALGGVIRVADADAFIGLHQPVAEQHPYIDHFWDSWRIVKGHKRVLTRLFLNRTYLPSRTTVGLTPKLRGELQPYILSMGGRDGILTEMQKASPEKMNWIGNEDRSRETLGLVTGNAGTLGSLTSLTVCSSHGASTGNCIDAKGVGGLTEAAFRKP